MNQSSTRVSELASLLFSEKEIDLLLSEPKSKKEQISQAQLNTEIPIRKITIELAQNGSIEALKQVQIWLKRLKFLNQR